MLQLDDEDYETLGFARADFTPDEKTLRILWLRENYQRNPVSARRIWNRYAKSVKGKAATARRDAKRRERGYFAKFYAENKEKVKARVKAYHEKMKNDPTYIAKRKARDAARYAAKKGMKR